MNKRQMSRFSALAVLVFALVAGTVAVIFPPSLFAQSASVTGATMTWYGVYTATTSTSVSSTKEIGTGIKPPATNSDRITLPSSGSILIGYGYNLIGSPPTALVALTYRTIFPNGQYQDNIYDRLAINRRDLFIGQRLNTDSAAGTYSLQLWHNGGMLLEKTFTLSAAVPGSATTPAPEPSTAAATTPLTNPGCWIYKGDDNSKRTLCFFAAPKVTMENYNVTTDGKGWSTCDWTGSYTQSGSTITLNFAANSGKCTNGASSPKTTATCQFPGDSLSCQGSTIIAGKSYEINLTFQAGSGSSPPPGLSPAPVSVSALTRSNCWTYKGDDGDKRTLCFFDAPKVTMENYNVTTDGKGWSTCDWTGNYTQNGTTITLDFKYKSGKCSNGASSPKTTATCNFAGDSLACEGSTIISGKSYDLDLTFQ